WDGGGTAAWLRRSASCSPHISRRLSRYVHAAADFLTDKADPRPLREDAIAQEAGGAKSRSAPA
ncbi:MAG: hypothetical protein ACPIOQ_24665, partial [Promethearchaeia archaeon]